MEPLELVAVTGMSGAGRSTALRALEDLGYFCVDNIPPALVPQLLALLGGAEAPRRIGLGVDVRTGQFLEGAGAVLDSLGQSGARIELIFLDAQDDELVRRYSETRRVHPLAQDGNVPEAIRRERQRLSPLRARAGFVLDTTGMSVHDLRRTLVDHVARGSHATRMTTRVLSFGFKYGLPVDADLVFDLRHLANPHFVPALRPQTGLDAAVAEFVFADPGAPDLLADVTSLLRKLLPRYEREGKAYLTIALGCTGGRHRSVALAEALGAALRPHADVRVEHRDLGER